MLIKEVDFKNIKEYRNTKVIPVFIQYEVDCYEIAVNKKQSENAWPILQKLFYNKFYCAHKEYLDSLFDIRLFGNATSPGVYIFSRSDKTFKNELSTIRNTAVKFANDAYVCLRRNNYENLLVLRKIVNDVSLTNFRLFVSTVDEIQEPDFEKEYASVKRQFIKKKKNQYKIKKGNLVVGHINGLVLTEEEKLIKYVRREFDNKTLIGDIVLSEEQEVLLNKYMATQLKKFVNTPIKNKTISFKPDYSRVFALGLVRYAMKNYNKSHSGDFWPHFKTNYGISISSNKQQYLHTVFKNILICFGKVYDENSVNKIDNITMHSFVADNSAFQLFDYLFDFWRLDLARNSENLNNGEEGELAFKTLIEAMKKNTTQDVMSHTSLLLNFSKTKIIVKNRVKRIIKLINDAFWNDTPINETGNRINHLLNMWITNQKGTFQKEKNYVSRFSSKEKGETMFHAPVFNITYETGKIQIILPHQRLIDCGDGDYPIWKIECVNSKNYIEYIKPEYKKDKIGYYVERTNIEIPINLILSEFTLKLLSGDKELRKYKIDSSNIRFFDEKGKNIDYKKAIIPEGYVTAYSNNEEYPSLLKDSINSIRYDEIFIKAFNLAKGQIVVLDDGTGLQVGQRLKEGLAETYPVDGVIIKSNALDYEVYSELPKILFKSTPDQLPGISLTINGSHNKIIEKTIKEFKFADDLKTTCYMLDLSEFISIEGLYTLVLNFPKMHVQKNLGTIAYIKGFDFRFKEAPYIFKEYGTISFKSSLRINKKQSENDGEWQSNINTNNYIFNFGERNVDAEGYCRLIEDRKLKLEYTLNGVNYPIYFDIPALYWKFNESDEWSTKPIANVILKDLKNKNKRLYVSGPFNFNKSVISTTNDVDIAEEESEIKYQNVKGNCFFDVTKIFDWFKNDRNEVFRQVFISLNGMNYVLFNIICKSTLLGVNLIGDFENSIIKGEVDIEGNESYTVSIYHNNQIICEDEQIIDKQFCIKTSLEPGDYEIYVYEISNIDEDNDGFESESTAIQLNSNPIIKRLINLKNLTGQIIRLKGYQDLKKKYMPIFFKCEYIIFNLEKITYEEYKNSQEEWDFYGIWNENINTRQDEVMSQFTYYKAKLGAVKYDGSRMIFSDVVVMYLDTMNSDSIILLNKDEQGAISSLVINKELRRIVSTYQLKKMSRFEKRQCTLFFDDKYYYITEIEEEI